jgi:hypothetical protein
METTIAEKRGHQRHRVFKAGKIGFNRGSVIDCLVRNVSESGALLQVVTPLGIPDRFDLMIEGEKAPRACRIMWRKERQIGVAFQTMT